MAKTKSKKRTWLKAIGYPLFFLLVLIPCLFQTFPFDRLKGRLLVEAEKQIGYDLEVGQLDPGLLGSVVLTDVKIFEKARGKRAAEAKRTPTFAFDQVAIQLGLLALVTGSLEATVTVELMDGELSGTFGEGDKGPQLDLTWNDLDLAAATVLEEQFGVQLGGVASGHAEVTLERSKLSKASGEIALKIAGAKIRGGKAKGFKLPPIRIGDLDWTAQVDKGKVTLKKIEAESEDLNFSLEGTLSLADKPLNSRLNLRTTFGFAEPFLEKHKDIKGGLSLIKRAKSRKDDSYGYRLTGTLRRPTPRAWRR